MRRFFLALTCAAVVFLGLGNVAASDAYRVRIPWQGKFVLNYVATFHNAKPVTSIAYFDRAVDDAESRDDCMRTAYGDMMATAKRRNPRAVKITYTGTAGDCWRGAKPGEPLAWSSFAKGKAW
jgi:hypothetical protein